MASSFLSKRMTRKKSQKKSKNNFIDYLAMQQVTCSSKENIQLDMPQAEEEISKIKNGIYKMMLKK